MAVLNLSEVSKQFQVNRSTIYRAVSSGRLSRRADGSFDLAEVIRCFGEPKKVGISQLPATPQQNTDEELERLRREFSEYKRQAQEREDWFKNQIDRMQTLLEMKIPVAYATPQQHPIETPCDTQSATSKTTDKKDFDTDAIVHATLQKQAAASSSNTENATVQHYEKKRGLLSRLASAVFNN